MVYLDSAATSFPKIPEVVESTFEFIKTNCQSSGRSAHRMGVESSRRVFRCRQMISEMFNAYDISRIAFTKNCTEALNLGLHSAVEENCHVITTCFEHNSIIRVLEDYKKSRNITVTYLEPDENFDITAKMVEDAIQENTALIAVNHANNLVGTYNDIEAIGKVAKKHNIIFLVDAAQSAGKKNIDIQKMNIDILCAPGHKSLFGFSGTGFVCFSENVKPRALMFGGTGSFSDVPKQPEIMPDVLESGTSNVTGIVSLLESLKWLENYGLEKIEKEENDLTHYMLKELSKIEGLIIYTPDKKDLASIVSFNIKHMDSSILAAELDEKYDIAVRAGIHCNPLGHRYLGTIRSGFVRASVSIFNTKEDIDYLAKALKNIIAEQGLDK